MKFASKMINYNNMIYFSRQKYRKKEKKKIFSPWYYITKHPLVITQFFLAVAQFLTIAVLVVQCDNQATMNEISKDMHNVSSEMSRKMYDSEVHKMVSDFLSPDMTNRRAKCTNLKDKYCREPAKYKEKLMFIFKREITDKYENEWEAFLKEDSVLHSEYLALIRFFRYFEPLSHYELSEANVRTVHFYYVWWRSFMIDMIAIYSEAWNTIDNSSEHGSKLSFKPHWADSLIYKLDEKMETYNLPLK